MNVRVDIANQIFSNIYVLEFNKKQNTHAKWKCLCMLCNKLTYVTYSNLISGNSKSCQSCGQKVTNYKQDCEILEKFDNGCKISSIAKEYKINRAVVNRILIGNKRK